MSLLYHPYPRTTHDLRSDVSSLLWAPLSGQIHPVMSAGTADFSYQGSPLPFLPDWYVIKSCLHHQHCAQMLLKGTYESSIIVVTA